MAERDTFVDVNDGDQLNQGYFNGIFDVTIKSVLQDQTGGTIDNSTTETEIGEVSIPANEVDSGVFVIATGTTAGNSDTHTVRLYGGTSATGTTNTKFKEIVVTNIGNEQSRWTIVYWITGLTWSSINLINITGENGAAVGGKLTTCDSIVCVTI